MIRSRGGGATGGAENTKENEKAAVRNPLRQRPRGPGVSGWRARRLPSPVLGGEEREEGGEAGEASGMWVGRAFGARCLPVLVGAVGTGRG